ncbi:RHS repeat-associated core domain-containing protein [Neorhizobium sp. NCHU2750]|uniref:RHS repeat-associated core domain-containing protein n=1 Tax=Neorhizobium sp. NCHU2750 TaxID=1825976 RepID=UPI000E76856E|nr:hypothetical protein NCHU2750_59140 [Neorhizobium sp. NCHU2750]
MQSTAPATDYGYAGIIYNSDGGLYLTQFRAYDPVAGRWLSRDPAGEAADQSGNLCAYVNGNTINEADSTGQFGLAGALIGGALGAGGDFAYQMYKNGGNVSCTDWGEVALSGAGGALLGSGAEFAAGLLGRSAAVAAEGTGTVWDAVTATQGVYEGTAIPRSFTLATSGADIWVAPNATEHMAEYALGNLGRGVSTDLVNIGTQSELTKLRAAVGSATQGGVPYGGLVNAGGWELLFSPARQAGQLPALIHAASY